MLTPSYRLTRATLLASAATVLLAGCSHPTSPDDLLPGTRAAVQFAVGEPTVPGSGLPSASASPGAVFVINDIGLDAPDHASAAASVDGEVLTLVVTRQLTLPPGAVPMLRGYTARISVAAGPYHLVVKHRDMTTMGMADTATVLERDVTVP